MTDPTTTPQPGKPENRNVLSRLLSLLARYKDGITALIAVTLFVLGVFQYLEYRADLRISTSLDMLKRRETSLFVTARAKLIRKWLETEGLLENFQSTETYTDKLIKAVSNEIFTDEDYRSALLHMSAYYQNAAGCTLDGVCDAATICSSLGGEIQDYLDVNKGYFAYARSVRDEDAVSLYLSLPEFANYCKADLGALMFSRNDQGFLCQTGLYIYRMTGSSWFANANCHQCETKYGQSVIDAAAEISNKKQPVKNQICDE
jgi:hypothetical protein